MSVQVDDLNLNTAPNALPLPTMMEPRESLIRTASKFLQNPRVRRTTLAQKQSFLRQKGLTDEEIQLACEQAGSFLDEEALNQSNALIPFRKLPYQEDKRLSLWVKAKDIANLVALISIGSYSLYSFWKRYVAPRFFGARSRHEQNYEKLLLSIGKLTESVQELKDLLQTMQQTNTLQQRSSHSSHKSSTAQELHEVRNELASIKGLLLNRSQFPSSPGIPSWQMLENEDVQEDDSNQGRRARKDRKLSQRKLESDIAIAAGGVRGEDEVDPENLLGSPSAIPIRKHPSLDSNNGFNSGGSSCEVVFVGKNDSSDPDHSDD